jgi:hypothetical protein
MTDALRRWSKHRPIVVAYDRDRDQAVSVEVGSGSYKASRAGAMAALRDLADSDPVHTGCRMDAMAPCHDMRHGSGQVIVLPSCLSPTKPELPPGMTKTGH